MEEEGNVYTCLDTPPQESTRTRTRKGARGSNQSAGGWSEVCMYICMQA